MEYPWIIKAPIKCREGGVSINILVDSGPEGTGKHGDWASSNLTLMSDIYGEVDIFRLSPLCIY